MREWLVDNLTGLTYSELTTYQQEDISLQLVIWLMLIIVLVTK